MLKGVNQWCFPNGTPLEHIFKTSREAGFDAVELNVYKPGEVGLTLESTEKDVLAIGAMARDNGLELRSLSSSLTGANPLSSPDEAVRTKGLDVIRKMIEIAQLLKADTILVVPGRVTADVAYDDCYYRSQEQLLKIIPELEQGGVHMGIENVWNKFLLSPLEMARYIDELGSAHAGAYYDVGNTLLLGFPEQWIRILGQRIRKVHVKDFRTAVGVGSGFVPLLAGDVNWAAVREALNAIGYTDALTAEIKPYAYAPDQAIFDTARQLDQIIG